MFDWYINVDCIKWKWVDKIMDLDEYPRDYPRDFDDNCADEIYCDNILEHLDFWESHIRVT